MAASVNKTQIIKTGTKTNLKTLIINVNLSLPVCDSIPHPYSGYPSLFKSSHESNMIYDIYNPYDTESTFLLLVYVPPPQSPVLFKKSSLFSLLTPVLNSPILEPYHTA